MTTPLILIVEDDEKSRRLLRDVLQVRGYQTVETDTAEEGLQLARTLGPALILMDIRLPGMSGVAALKILRSQVQTQAIPVIAVTASLLALQLEEGNGATFDAMQPKPISMADLLSTMQRLLRDGRQVAT